MQDNLPTSENATRVVFARCLDARGRQVDVRKRLRKLGEHYVTVKGEYWVSRIEPAEAEVETLSDLYRELQAALLHDVSQSYCVAVVQGALTGATRSEAASDGSISISDLEDEPRHVQWLDGDRFNLPNLTPEMPLGVIGEFCRQHVLPPEFADAELIVMATGSHGAFESKLGKPGIRLRIALWLEKPMKPSVFAKYVARRLNIYAAQHAIPGERVFDESIYNASRMLFFGMPVCDAEFPARSVFVDPQKRLAWIEARNALKSTVVIDESIVAEAEIAAIAASTLDALEKRRNNAALASDWNKELKPDNFRKPILQAIASGVHAIPYDAIGDMVADVRAHIIKAAEQYDETARRIEQHGDIRKLWQEAIRARQKFVARNRQRDVTVKPAHYSVAEARSAQQPLVTAALSKLMRGEDGVATLIRAPVGLGKTREGLAALATKFDGALSLEAHRIMWLVPTHKLVDEVVERARPIAPHLVRPYRGRELLCVDAEYGAAAKVLEDVGLSPAKAVCERCPSRGVCPYIAQRADKAPGLIVAPHAVLTSLLAQSQEKFATAPALVIVDESPLSTMMQDAAVDLQYLRSPPAPWHDWPDPILVEDWRKRRHMLAKALSTSTRRVPLEALHWLVDDSAITPPWRAALEVEWIYQKSIAERLNAYVESKTKSRQAQLERDAKMALRASAVAEHIYRAVGEAAAKRAKHLRGVRVRPGVPQLVTAPRLARLASAISQGHTIWLDATADPRAIMAYLR